MAKYLIEIHGVPGLQAKLRTLPVKIQRALVRSVLREAMRPAQAAIAAQTPVGKDAPGHQAGTLQRSIKLRAMRSRKGRVGVRVTTGLGLFKGKAFYGGMVEYGTKKMAARGFMLAGFRSVEASLQADVQDRLAAAINQAAMEAP